ncbi:hypothetical protein EAH88_11300 [Rhodanobacter glycinis]|uniref:Uncharacterized protein n=1 Tax=Rhodanobacter glycinis TaxID=582702 RepID=A0A502C5Y5_9GAMM|nr:hypothetical protein EAH88_11300 [Rhodanobacter glycinis]
MRLVMLNGSNPAQVSPWPVVTNGSVSPAATLLFEPAQVAHLAMHLVDHCYRHLDRAHRADAPAGMFQRHAMAVRNVERRVGERGAYRVVDRQGRVHLWCG